MWRGGVKDVEGRGGPQHLFDTSIDLGTSDSKVNLSAV